MIFIIVCYVIKTDGQCRLKFNAGSTHCSDTGCRKWRYYTLTDGKRFTTFFLLFPHFKIVFYIVNVSMLKSVAYCTVGQWQEYRKLRYVSHMSKDLYIKISAHFGIESVENLIADRRNRFINRYGETDNHLCQMLRWLVQFVWLYFLFIVFVNFRLLNLSFFIYVVLPHMLEKIKLCTISEAK